MEDESKKKSEIDDELNGFSLIDFSIVDDSLLVSPSDTEAGKDDIIGGTLMEESQLLYSPGFLESEAPKRQGTCNMRKSLAWDSAFFTSAGVLDPEELSSIIEGAEVGRGEKQLLPRIHEDLSKSTDSISTFESDSLALQSLEADLFCDIRASIQRSSKASHLGLTGSSAVSCETESSDDLRLKAVESAVGNAVKPKSGSNKLNTGVQGLGKTTRPGSANVQPGVRGRGSNPLVPRPHEMAHKASTIAPSAANIRMSVAASRSKSDVGDAVNVKGRGTIVSKVPPGGDSRSGAPKRMSSLRSSSCGSVMQKAGIPSCRSSCDSSTSSSEIKSNCPPNVGQTKVERTVTFPAGAKLKNPPLVSSRSKYQPGNSQRSTFVKSTSKIPSNISPSSSVSEWSTESSSSTATVNQKIVSSKGCSTSSTGDELDGSALQKQARDENQTTRLPCQPAQRTSKGTGPFTNAVSEKPSGLRLPSPKIGFFDGGKAGGGRVPNSGLQPHPGRSGAASQSPNGSSTKRSVRNMAAKTSPAAAGKLKLSTHRTGETIKLSVSPVVDDASSISAEKTPLAGKDESCSDTSSGYGDGSSLEARKQTSLKSGSSDSETKCNREMPDLRQPIAESGSGARKNGTAGGSLKNKKIPVGKSRLQHSLDENSKLSTPKSGSGIKEVKHQLDESISSGKSNEADTFSKVENESSSEARCAG
ncbi:hypothetical protein Dimus_034592 [Dionaea muscipula]